jgi:predicted ATPase
MLWPLGPPRSACSVRRPGSTRFLEIVSSNSALNSVALSRSATHQPTTRRLIAQTGATAGDLLVENLRENDKLRAKVNSWLQRFGIDIDVKRLEEIIYRLAVRSKGHTFDLDITDVGFGISQVLPILVEGFASPPGKVIMIEQPEIHLHPKMQGELADLFIDIANLGIEKDSKVESRRCLLIETHSEYLLSRLRRRIAEGKIRHSDVALYFVEKVKGDGGSTIKGSYMPADGGFEWPADFFEDDLEDTLAITVHVVPLGGRCGIVTR